MGRSGKRLHLDVGHIVLHIELFKHGVRVEALGVVVHILAKRRHVLFRPFGALVAQD